MLSVPSHGNTSQLQALFHQATFLYVLNFLQCPSDYHNSHERGADSTFLIRRGDLIQKFYCQILGNYSNESSFLYYQKCQNFFSFSERSTFRSYYYKKLNLYKPVFNHLLFIKKLLLNYYFCAWFLL